jgi:hypothetical protein
MRKIRYEHRGGMPSRDPNGAVTRTVSVRFTADELDLIEVAADARGLDRSTLIRDTLESCGIL